MDHLSCIRLPTLFGGKGTLSYTLDRAGDRGVREYLGIDHETTANNLAVDARSRNIHSQAYPPKAPIHSLNMSPLPLSAVIMLLDPHIHSSICAPNILMYIDDGWPFRDRPDRLDLFPPPW